MEAVRGGVVDELELNVDDRVTQCRRSSDLNRSDRECFDNDYWFVCNDNQCQPEPTEPV